MKYFFLYIYKFSYFIYGNFFFIFFLCEAYYIKSFLALSSILNTLFIFLALNGLKIFDFFFFL